MTYNTVADMAVDPYLLRRITAAAATEVADMDPEEWADAHAWVLASSPGWAEAWDSAEAAGIPLPGQDEGVITDGMILAAVQGVDAP